MNVNVVITLATLLGLADDPGRVDGVGPVPGDVARALAADGRWRDGGTSRRRSRWGRITDTITGLVVATSPPPTGPAPRYAA